MGINNVLSDVNVRSRLGSLHDRHVRVNDNTLLAAWAASRLLERFNLTLNQLQLLQWSTFRAARMIMIMIAMGNGGGNNGSSEDCNRIGDEEIMFHDAGALIGVSCNSLENSESCCSARSLICGSYIVLKKIMTGEDRENK